MDLAKPTIDVWHLHQQPRGDAGILRHHPGLALRIRCCRSAAVTNSIALPLANGSVIKLMHTADHLPPRRPGGYETIMIASSSAKTSSLQPDPDHNAVEIIPTGQDDVTQLELRVGVSDPDAFATFYTQALGATAIGQNRFKIGESIIGVFHAPAIRKRFHRACVCQRT